MPAVKSPMLASPLSRRQAERDTSSPSYFGLHSSKDSNAFLTGSSAQHAKTNWSPPSSAVRSAAAMSPVTLPNDQRPEFEAFRRQSEGKVFNLGTLASYGSSAGTASLIAPARPLRTSSNRGIPRVVTSDVGAGNMSDHSSRHRNDSMSSTNLTVAHSPKRVLSPGLASSQEQARRQSPATDDPVVGRRNGAASTSSSSEDHKRSFFSGPAKASLRSESSSTPSDSDFNSDLLITSQQFSTLLTNDADSLLVLDLRVSTMYSTSHITSALNLCIPTTLLKRPSFNVQKLAETFKSDEQRAVFEDWQNCSYIVVYDNSSSQLKDASICLNTIKKFQTEGYTGTLHILKGGFLEFSRRYPSRVETNDGSSAGSPDRHMSDSDGPEVIPVAGGCPMPAADNAANPFFSNIRQNMDLIGGVGTMAIHHPKRADKATESRAFPEWLQRASDEADAGQSVSKKFEAIEVREKKRMEGALSCRVAWATPASAHAENVQIAGLEKGSKNRYNNIWPYEHSIVKIQGVPVNGCDYFNANHIKASWSHRRYISTQAPIPATFNDFWNVMWQQDVRVIMMLTTEQEGAQVKADNYWNMQRYGPLRLEFLSEKRASLDAEKIRRHRHRPSFHKRQSSTANPIIAEIKEDKPSEQPYVIVRKFTLSHEGHPFERMREVTQLQYTGWPDFGAPADPAHVVGLVRQCDAVVRSIEKTAPQQPARPDQRPILVHCSAGCGRTGTFCTVDSVIDMLKRQQLLNRKERSSSPMAIDAKSSDASGSGFFEVKATIAPEGGSDPDGPWLRRDDLDLIEKTVEDFRMQRLSMVQSLRQYVLCYESVMEWLIEQELDRSPGA